MKNFKLPTGIINYAFSESAIVTICVCIIFVIASCNNSGKSDLSDGDSSNVAPKNTINSVPNYAGDWGSDQDGWKISITKVSDELYDVKYYNPRTQEISKKISGPFQTAADYKSISRQVPVDYNDKNFSNDIGKEYRINYSDDGRLYWGGNFYSRQQSK